MTGMTSPEYHNEHQIRFIHNWNSKLSNPIFTTIRAYTSDKHNYYLDCLDLVFDVMLDGAKMCSAKLIGVDAKAYGDVGAHFLRVDTGIQDLGAIDILFKKFGVTSPRDTVIILTFARWQ